MLDPHTSDDNQKEIYDEPGKSSYYSNGPDEGSSHLDPDEGHDSDLESSVLYSDGE